MSSYQITPRIVFLSIVYFLVAALMLALIDIGLLFFFDKVAFRILNWFNDLHWVVKIGVLMLGGYAVFSVLLDVTARLTTLAGGLVFNCLPKNLFTLISSYILAFANAIYCVVWLWRYPNNYNFWVVVELILLSAFIWSLQMVVMPSKDQLNMYSNMDKRRY